MRNRIKANKRVFTLLALGLLLCGIVAGRTGLRVRAEEQRFLMDAEMMPSDKSAYEIRLKVENLGEDWEGTVRLMMFEEYYGGTNDCVYDTELSLPQGSTKQFVVRIPKDSISRTDGVVQVTLLDKNADKAAQQEFGRLLQAEADVLNLGILSDDYMSLTYLDMGGSEFYYSNKNYPIRLTELTQDKLADSLDSLNFLVIDSYNTGILTDAESDNIRQWTDNGGILIIGTGSRAEEALAGFDDLGIQCMKVNEPGAGTYNTSDYVDVSLLSMAELRDVNDKYKEGYYDALGLLCSQGNGAVEILPYSFSEAAKQNAVGSYEDQRDFVEGILRQGTDYANPGYGAGKYANSYDGLFFIEEMCGNMGNGSNQLRFGGLKLIVILYVIFVGPVLYLLLRFTKKQDFYWIAVPITTLVGIFLVYWAGRGFEIVDTHVYSVTVENLSGSGNCRTYLHCYDAGHKEWNLRLAEGYEYAGPLEDSYYRSSDGDYYYRIRREGERLFFGMNPSMGFEDGYFQAGIVREPEKGSIYSELQKNGENSLSGTVINETERDYQYFAVKMGEDLFVYKNLPAGAEIKLEDAEVVYDNDKGYYDGVMSYYYGVLRNDWEVGTVKNADSLAALGAGISFVYSMEDPDRTVIIALTEDWDKAVDDNCSEVSYGCLYAVQ